MPLLRRSTRIDGWTGEHVYGGAQSETHTVHSDIYIYGPSFLPGLEGPRRGRARRPHAHRPHLSDTKGHSGGPWKANGLHSTAHTGEYGLPKPYEWRHVRHQTGCGRHQTPAVWNAPVTETRGSGIWVGDRRSRSGVLGRSGGDAECSDHDFYPDSGTTHPTMSPEHPIRFSPACQQGLALRPDERVGNRSGWCPESIPAGGRSRTGRGPWDA